MNSYRRLVYVAAFLAYGVVAGAYVRLYYAGLGCPDWPGCSRRLVSVPYDAHEVALLRSRVFAIYGAFLGVILLLQGGLGVSNVLFRVPLAIAAARNGAAALLLVTFVMLNFTLFRRSER